MSGKIIFVSSRLPYEIYEEDGKLKYKESVSGLVTGVQAIFKDNEGIWIGWAGAPEEIVSKASHLTEEWEKNGYYTVELEGDLLTDSLESFCNRSLWSLFHYFLDFVDFEREEWESYKQYNNKFALAVIDKYQKGDTVFVNDFQLMLVPKILREAIPDIKIA
jgi:trehalose 6-phosphate synthase/phosphatase